MTGGVEFGIDWLTLTVWADRDAVKDYLTDLLGIAINWADTGHGGRGFRRLERGPYEVKVYSDPVSMGAAGDGDGPASSRSFCSVELPGAVWEWLSADAVLSWLRGLMDARVSWRPSRVDLRFDHGLFSPAQMCAEWEADAVDVGSRVRSLVKRHKAEYTRCFDPASDRGDIFRMGGRQSGRYLRCYRKRRVVDGQVAEEWTRVELEIKAERAEVVLADLVLTHRDGLSYAARAMSHLVDYVEFTSAGWWQGFVGGVERARLTLPRHRLQTAAALRSWVFKQCAPTIAALWAMLPGGDDDLLKALCTEGVHRLNDVHRHIIDLAIGEATAFNYGYAKAG